jgi:hypothetical protein
MGEKKGSTTGCFAAVCSAVRNRRGPTGFGMTMISGLAKAEFIGDEPPSKEEIVSLT